MFIRAAKELILENMVNGPVADYSNMMIREIDLQAYSEVR